METLTRQAGIVSALDVFKRTRCIASLNANLMALIWIGTVSSPSPSHAHLGLSFAFVHWCADVSAAVGGFVGGLAGPVDLAAYSVMHELQLCQRITSVAPWPLLAHTPAPSLPGYLWLSHYSQRLAYIQTS